MTSQRFVARSAFLLLALLVGTLAGCGGGANSSGAPTDCLTLKPGADGTSKLTVIGKNLAFDVTCVNVRPGPLKVTFENKDSGVAHDFHVTGTGVNQRTDLAAGVTTQVLEVVLTGPGTYTFACDPHATMEGQIHVVAKG